MEIPPTLTPTKTPTPIATVSPEEFKGQLSHALGGEWEEVSFGGDIVGFRIDNLEFVLPNWEVAERDFDSEHFLVMKNGGKIAPLVVLPANQIARFNDEGKIEIRQDSKLLTTVDPDIRWALTSSRDLVHEDKNLMVRIKPDPPAEEKPLVEAFHPETLEAIKSSLPAVIKAAFPKWIEVVTAPDINPPEEPPRFEAKLGRNWTPFFKEHHENRVCYSPTYTWQVGEPPYSIIEILERDEIFEGIHLVGFPQDKLEFLKEAIIWFKSNDPQGWQYLADNNLSFIKYETCPQCGAGASTGGCQGFNLPAERLPPLLWALPEAQKAYLASVFVHEVTHSNQGRRGLPVESERQPCLNQLETLKRLQQVRISSDETKQTQYQLELQAQIDHLIQDMEPGGYCSS